MALTGLAVILSIILTVYYKGELSTTSQKLQSVTKELVQAEQTLELSLINHQKAELALNKLRKEKDHARIELTAVKADLVRIRQGSSVVDCPVLPAIADRLRQYGNEVRSDSTRRTQ